MVGDTKEGDEMSTAGFSQITGLECIQFNQKNNIEEKEA